MSLRDRQRQQIHNLSTRKDARSQPVPAQRDGAGVIVNGNRIRAQNVSNEALGTGDTVVFSGDSGVVQQERRKVHRGAAQARPPKIKGEIKVFFSIQRKDSVIIEYWLGGDRSRPTKIAEYDTTQFTIDQTYGVATGSAQEDWIFTIKKYPKGQVNGPVTIKTFFGNGLLWEKTDAKAQYVSWFGLDFWQTYEVSASTRYDPTYTITRALTSTTLTRTQRSQQVRILEPIRAYFNSVWNLAFSGNRLEITIDIYENPPIESFLANHQTTDYTLTEQQSANFTLWSLFFENQTLQEKSIFWTETLQFSESSFTEYVRAQGMALITVVNATANSSRQAAYEEYVAPGVKKNSSIDVTQNGNLYSYFDSQDASKNVYIALPPVEYKSNKIEPYYCFRDGFMYSKGTGATTNYYVNIKGVETKIVFTPTNLNLISNNTNTNCWSVTDAGLQINIAPNVPSGDLPSGNTVEFTPRVFVGQNFQNQIPFEKRLLPINIGQTKDDNVVWISTQYWGGFA